MVQEITFTKMNGSANDFILIDHRTGFLNNLSLPRFAATICRRQEAVGADGLILIETSDVADFKWRFFNADGSEAEMCGNGGRCAARFACEKRIAGDRLSFETIAGIIHAQVYGRRVKIQLPLPHGLRCCRSITLESTSIQLHSLNTGVPHAIVLVQDLERAPVVEMGRTIRFHQEFQPAGTNVNFVRIEAPHTIRVRTYERGVEDETLACGTGSVASALIAAALGEAESPVQVKTRGGELLTVSFQREGAHSFSDVFLEGDTCLIYEGVLKRDILDQCRG